MSTAAVEVQQRPAGPPLGLPAFAAGFLAPARGLQFLIRHPQLWRFAAWPLAINLALTVAVLAGLALGVIWLMSRWQTVWPDAWWGGALELLAGMLLGGIALALAALTWFTLQILLGAWFSFELARETEVALGTPRNVLREAPLWQQLADAFVTTGRLLVLNLILLLLGVVPVVGTILSAVGCLICNAWVFGASYLDLPLSLRAMNRLDKRRLLSRHRSATLGLGTAILLMLLIPVIGALLLTTAVVGSVLLHQQLATRLAVAARSP